MNDDELLESLLPGWLEKHGSIFRLDHLESTYFYRRLTRREYRLVHLFDDEDERYDQIVETCMLWPQNWKASDHVLELAGIAQAVATAILTDSGCLDLEATKLKYDRAILEQVDKQMEATVDHIFGGGGDFDKYSDWSWDKLFESYACAKWVSEALLGRKVIEQPKEAAPRKGGLRQKSAVDPGGIAIPEVDSGSMAMQPMNEVMKKQRQAQRQAALRSMANQMTSVPANQK